MREKKTRKKMQSEREREREREQEKNAELMCAACEPVNVRFLVQITTDGMYT